VSEPAKDEADLVQCMAKAMHDSVYGGESAWMDVSKTEQSYREMEADAALAAIRAAKWAVVPVAELDILRAENARLREALKNLLDRDERYTCQHEETHRGGFLWEICDCCGAKWADDMGGKTEWKDPPEWVAAHAALEVLAAEEPPHD